MQRFWLLLQKMAEGEGEMRLEVCVDSYESAVIAQRGGADRLEVCSNLIIGGTTPGVSQFRQIRKDCGIELNVLIRPRFGDFLYTEQEFLAIVEDVRLFRELGADGVVVGCLNADGSLNLKRMETLRKCAGGMNLTLHRAFDVCSDPYRALKEAVGLGADTVLTSGQASDCMKGKGLLKELIGQADGKIEILVGGGVNADVIHTLKQEIHAESFHMSGKALLKSEMAYRKEEVNMGLKGLEEFVIFRTDEGKVREAKRALQQ